MPPTPGPGSDDALADPARPAVPIVDLHADLLWRSEHTGKDPWADCPGEMLDLPRMLRHGPSLQCFAIFTPGDLQGEAATEYGRGLVRDFRALVERGEGRLRWALSRDDVLAAPADGLTGMLSMESVSPLAGSIELLDEFHDAGVRVIGITHNPRNEAADGCMVAPEGRRGLTAFGLELVERMIELGIVLDVAHLAPEGIDDVLSAAEAHPVRPPVISTHGGCRALTDHVRNLDDDQLRRMAATDGLLGITLYPGHIAIAGRERSLDDALDQIEHVASVCGVGHVALGADLDGFTAPGLPGGGDRPECYAVIAAGLTARGWNEDDVARVLGGNALRVLAAVLR